MCCVAVCYPQTWKCLAVDPFVEVGVSLLGSSLPAGLQGLLLCCVSFQGSDPLCLCRFPDVCSQRVKVIDSGRLCCVPGFNPLSGLFVGTRQLVSLPTSAHCVDLRQSYDKVTCSSLIAFSAFCIVDASPRPGEPFAKESKLSCFRLYIGRPILQNIDSLES